MSRVPDETHSWPTEAEGEAALGSLRQQVENARQRLGQQWSQIHEVESAALGEGDEAQA